MQDNGKQMAHADIPHGSGMCQVLAGFALIGLHEAITDPVGPLPCLPKSPGPHVSPVVTTYAYLLIFPSKVEATEPPSWIMTLAFVPEAR